MKFPDTGRKTACGIQRKTARPKAGRCRLAKEAAEDDGNGQTIHKLTLLPDWLRHLPEMVAESMPTPTSEPTSDPKPEPDTTANVAADTRANAAADCNTGAGACGKASADASTQRQRFVARAGDVDRELEGVGGWWAGEQVGGGRFAADSRAGAGDCRGSDEATAILDRLAELVRQTPALAAKVSDRAYARRWREIELRAGPQNRYLAAGGPAGQGGDGRCRLRPCLDSKKLADCLAKIEAVTGDSAEGRAWREFLLIDALKEHCTKQPLPDERLSRETAGQALIRITQTPLTPEQQRFVSSPPVAALRVELWHWAAEPISVAELLRDIERYEWTRLPSDARRLAVDCQSLWASPVEARRRLADRVDVHYRNANFRFAVTEELLNDLIPEQKMEYAQVHDTVLGRPVEGESLMATEVGGADAARPAPVRVWRLK